MNMEWGTFSKSQSEQKISKLLSVIPDAIVSRTPRSFVTSIWDSVCGREVVIVDVELYTWDERKKIVLSSFQYNNLDDRK
jgi:gentisate 1,2-dioxygenase